MYESAIFLIVHCTKLMEINMASKKKTSVKGNAISGAEQKPSSVVPFPPFISDFTNNKDTMETLMNTQKNQFEKISADATEQARQASDILTKSGTVMMKGIEQIMKTCMGIAQTSSEKNAEAVKQLMACKTINEFTEIQNRLSQQNFDELMQNATKLSEICIKVCTEAFDPINDQFSKAIKKASDQMAA
jgi:phasin family protein